MIGLDTNVLVRYIVQDHPSQSRLASDIIESQCSDENPGLICDIVLCELVWVLRSAYHFPKSDVLTVLEQLLRVNQMRVESPQKVWNAIQTYRTVGADFADHMIGNTLTNLSAEYTVTFDKCLSQAVNLRVIA